jgi:prepilin-type N-terminal cleavage/methylation domain-containing protein
MRKNGFTLIELLVVVLIIGILAAVAVPQYKKAVEKSRATQAITLLKSVAEAYKTNLMATGSHATTFDQLDIDIPFSGTTPWSDILRDAHSNADWSLQLGLTTKDDHTPSAVIFMGRISGKYTGTGFAYFIDGWEDPKYYLGGPHADTLSCMEQSSVVNTYCKKLMGSTDIIQIGFGGRFYDMP